VTAMRLFVWGMGSMADDFVILQEDAQQLIDAAAAPQRVGEYDADEVFQIDDFELSAIVNVREATQAKDR
jgi:hypothetical protein